MNRPSLSFRILASLLIFLPMLAMAGCPKAAKLGPDYNHPLPPGASALRKITNPADLPDLSQAFARRDMGLAQAIDRSLAWFAKPSTQQFYPFDPHNNFTHDQSQASVFAMGMILAHSNSAEEFQARVREEFDTYISVGYDDKGGVLFTGYYTPIFTASRTRTDQYKYPLYKRPPDLVSDPVTGNTLGRRQGAGTTPYPTRREIESSGMLAGTELVWLADKLDAYIIQVNGSAKLNMIDGSTMTIGYSGNNGYDYTSIGRTLVAEGKLDQTHLNLAHIKEYFSQHPAELDQYLQKNDRFVFFQEYSNAQWPAGSLGVKVTDLRSLATDKTVFPRGNLTLVTTQVTNTGGQLRRFEQLMLDQDTGGAIRAAGRADVYMGVGPEAEGMAGRQFAEGRLYYFFLKPEKVQHWLDQLHTRGGAVVQ